MGVHCLRILAFGTGQAIARRPTCRLPTVCKGITHVIILRLERDACKLRCGRVVAHRPPSGPLTTLRRESPVCSRNALGSGIDPGRVVLRRGIFCICSDGEGGFRCGPLAAARSK